jgi:hypothetical protein
MQLVAVVLVVIGLVTLAAPPPAQAFDPQLALALASTAGAIALIVGYLIVANGRENQRAASLEGVYACGAQEAAGPMGCGGPVSSGYGPASTVVATGPESPLVAGDRGRPGSVGPVALGDGCPAGQVAGPMGCSAAEPTWGAAVAADVPAPQGQ